MELIEDFWSQYGDLIIGALITIAAGLILKFLSPFTERFSSKGMDKRDIRQLRRKIERLRTRQRDIQKLRGMGDFEIVALRQLYSIAAVGYVLFIVLVFVGIVAFGYYTTEPLSPDVRDEKIGGITLFLLATMTLSVLFGMGALIYLMFDSNVGQFMRVLSNHPLEEGEIDNISLRIADLEGKLEDLKKQGQ